MDLEDYVPFMKKKDRRYTIGKFCKEIGVGWLSYRQFVLGKRLPTSKTAIKIHEVTNGLVDGWELLTKINDQLEGKNV
jgi:hypothetical protein